MADLTVVYTLTTPGGTILFNNGTLKSLDDLYWVQNIRGLDSTSIRAPIDDAPQAHGAIIHNFWKGARHVGFEGVLLIQSVPLGSPCQQELNGLESALTAALESILQTNGVLSWTPLGGGAQSLDVRYEIPLEITPSDNYATRSFTFGLVAVGNISGPPGSFAGEGGAGSGDGGIGGGDPPEEGEVLFPGDDVFPES